jgi:Leucine-rich repeat (LRR) protein
MHSNGLVGPLPSEIFSPSLVALQRLNLNNNKLTGQIPDNYGQLPSLEYLMLNDNKFSGTLPAIAKGDFSSLGKHLAL